MPMSSYILSSSSAFSPGVNNRTLMTMRWVAVFGQTATVLLIHFGLGISVPLIPAFGFILSSVALNLFMIRARGGIRGLSTPQAFSCLSFDIVQISGLLFLTGGIENPFSILLLAPVTVGASLLPFRAAGALTVLALGCIVFVAAFHRPLPSMPILPPLYLAGFEVSVFLTIAFTAAYVWWTSSEARKVAAALNESRLALSRQSKIAALGAQAAAAAHELGSPLSTIYVIASDLKKGISPDDPLAEDCDLLVSQSRRCKDILSAFARRPAEGGEELDPVGPFWPQALLAGIVEPLCVENPAIDVHVESVGDKGWAGPLIARTPEMVHGIGTLIQNAIQFAKSHVTVRASWTPALFSITIEDDGPGFPPGILARMGEPYLSTRRGNGRNMGLGVFISRTMLEPTGAVLRFSNRPEGGARVDVTWDRADIETGHKIS